MFYELQRTYQISERIQKLTPVILVANEMPAPNEIDDAWLVEHDWILRRTILDDSFRPALDYLKEELRRGRGRTSGYSSRTCSRRRTSSMAVKQQIQVQAAILQKDEQDLLEAVRDLGQSQQQQGIVDIVKRIFDPLGITGQADTGAVSAAQGMLDYAKEARGSCGPRAGQAPLAARGRNDRAAGRGRQALRGGQDALRQGRRDRPPSRSRQGEHPLLHAGDLEPRASRPALLPSVQHRCPGHRPARHAGEHRAQANVDRGSRLWDSLRGRDTADVNIAIPTVDVEWKKLVEVADLDNVLGYKGNYTIFPLKENNYLTLHMMQDYLDVGDELLLRDPDETGDYSIDELSDWPSASHDTDKDLYEDRKEELKQLLRQRLTSSRADRRPRDRADVIPLHRMRSSARIRCSRTSSSCTAPST